MGKEIADQVLYIMREIAPCLEILIAYIGYKTISNIKSEKKKENIFAILTYVIIIYFIVISRDGKSILLIIESIAFILQLIKVNLMKIDRSSLHHLDLICGYLYLLCFMASVSAYKNNATVVVYRMFIYIGIVLVMYGVMQIFLIFMGDTEPKTIKRCITAGILLIGLETFVNMLR